MTIKEYLMDVLEDVYCNTCRNNGKDRPCDECHRKEQFWGISEKAAEKMQKDIIERCDRE